MTRVKIGIVGCGEVAQIIHMPALKFLSDQFEIVALCDISRTVLEAIAREIPGAATYSGHAELVRDENVDAVLVANPHAYHAEVALAAMEAGKDVFIEKPMCMTLAEADQLADVQRRTGRIVQVGYMRRFAGAFLEAVELMRKDVRQVKFARVQDFIGKNALIIEDTSRVIRDPEVPESAKESLKALEEARIAEAIGVGTGDLAIAYKLLLGLSSHDISAMRELLGRPKRVLHATRRAKGRCITATFDYGDFVCEFATGVDGIPRFDAFLEVYSDELVVRVEYETPYIRNLPARLIVTRPDGTAGVNKAVSFPSRLDSFVVEWRAFHDAVTRRIPPKTTIADAREDLEIFREIIEAMEPQMDAAIAATGT